MKRFHANIEAPEHGWMRFYFHGDGGEIDISASYTPNDSFYDFVTALHATCTYGLPNKVIFNEEPEEVELILERSGDCPIVSSKRKTGNIWITVNFESGCKEIARNLHHLFNKVGYDEFAKRWGHSPPRERLKELRSIFSSEF